MVPLICTGGGVFNVGPVAFAHADNAQELERNLAAAAAKLQD